MENLQIMAERMTSQKIQNQEDISAALKEYQVRISQIVNDKFMLLSSASERWKSKNQKKNSQAWGWKRKND